MGFLRKLKDGQYKTVAKIGNVLSKAAPVLGFIPGVGTLAAAGLGAAGGLMSGGGLSGALKGGAMGAGGGLLSSKVGGFSGALQGIKGALSNPGGTASGAMDILTGNGDGGGSGGFLGNLLKYGIPALGAYQGYQGYKQAKDDSNTARQYAQQAGSFGQQAADLAMQRYNEGAGARQQYQNAVMGGVRDPSNPFSQLYG